MIARLLVTATLAVLVLGLLQSAAPSYASERVFVWGLVIGVLSYHRHLLGEDGKLPVAWPLLPTGDRMRVRYSLGPVLLAHGTSVRVTRRAQERATRRPATAMLLELLPVPLQWQVRKPLR
jgi:hypothetical protein